MNISQKLKIIKDLSGLPQEKLAQQIGVTFATLNSWLNKRSHPHKNRQKQIDKLYFKYTGQKEIPDNILEAKKDIISIKSKKYKNIIKYIKENKDIYDEFVLSLTYNTNRIEGSTLTEDETADILFENTILPNKSLTEHLEAKNHQVALNYLFNLINNKFKIDDEYILKLHNILMNGIKEDAGQYRKHAVRIVGANIPTANYLKVPILMKKLTKDMNKKEADILSLITKTHSRFEQIHPFSDDNGRIGRLLIHTMLLRKNLPPAVIRQEKKRPYLRYLNKSQKSSDFDLLEKLMCDAVLGGFKILERR